MNFEFSEEQTMLRDMLAAFLKDRLPFERRRAAIRSEAGYLPAIWQEFAAELGILGASFPEEVGGFGGGVSANLIVMEELGKALATEPWLETIVMAGALLQGLDGQARELLSAIMAGEALVVPANCHPVGMAASGAPRVTARREGVSFILSGEARLVRNGGRATHFLVAAQGSDTGDCGLFVVPAACAGLSLMHYPLIDGSRCLDMTLDEVRVGIGNQVCADDDAERRLAEAFDHGVAGLCAEALGIQRMLVEWTVAYARQRSQFGRPIAEFQVLQHRMAEMFIKVEESASMLCLLTARLADEPRERARCVSAAKVLVDQSGRFIGEAAVQIHGGMGMTRELPIADYFSRLVAICEQIASTEFHFQRYEAATFNG